MRGKTIVLMSAFAGALSAFSAVEQQPPWDQPTHYRGFTFQPWLKRGKGTDPYNTAELVRMHDKFGANMVRLHLRPTFCAQQNLGDRTKYWEASVELAEELEAIFDMAKFLKMAVVLDMHESPPLPEEIDGPLREKFKDNDLRHARWEEPALEAGVNRFWRGMAKLCKDRTEQVIWFDLYNEPLDWKAPGLVPTRWWQIAQSTTRAIREIDKIHPVVVEPGPGGIYGNFANFKPIEDTVPVIYSPHSYREHSFTHQFVGNIANTDLSQVYKKRVRYPTYGGNPSAGPTHCREQLIQTFKCVRDFQLKHKVRIWVGEWSCIRWAPDVEQYFVDSLEIFEKYGWDWTYHAWKEWNGWNIDFKETIKTVPVEESNRAKIIRKWMKGYRPAGSRRRFAGTCPASANVVDYAGRRDFTCQPRPGSTWTETTVQYPILRTELERSNEVAWGPEQIAAEIGELLKTAGKDPVVRFSCSGYAPNARGYVRDVIRVCEEKGVDWCCAATEPTGWCDDILKDSGATAGKGK